MGPADTLLSPVILFFVLGVLAAAVRSDLTIPESMAKAMSLFLMAAIGLKGGVQVSAAGLSGGMVAAGLAGLVLSFALPFLAFFLLRRWGRLDGLNAGAVAACYGSASVVTFATASEALTRGGMAPAGYMVAVLAIMETPAIVSGMLLARRGTPGRGRPGGHVWREVLLNGSVVLLLGSFAIGAIIGKARYEPIAPMFTGLWSGVLCLFLLDMGLIAVRRLRDSKAVTLRLGMLAVALPIINGSIGALVARGVGLDPGSAAAFAILAASASYIAVPAAMRLALPKADPGLYLSLSLAITFPFNILFGIPLFIALSTALAR
ncbi:sodium-dependent bicarbonate transport family permease [Novosphingobium aerophilum]|uniref:Sodium-dependent bicarbonate transport family permease n=1 Tax=Novosphingobium aerophilum TaxID=2839843 RepID=A0A7X1F8T0_9SPHN|nr:sodium-dependent bicarbonate transport family permease [Novosphingobium aerophilum]MBC2652487.1 sodium-dependent bicarbonate transport family permease [Novosphingobium aerophilum]